jgi:tellurite resistance protein TerC
MIEKSPSMDSVFVIASIFGFFAIPRALEHRVLFRGIMGVIVLRALMIALGATLLAQFSGLLYVFGLFLLATGVKVLFISGKPLDPNTNPVFNGVLYSLVKTRNQSAPSPHESPAA